MKKIQKFQCLDFKYVDGIFFEKDAFYLELKQENITDQEYENCKYLSLTLKMRNLSDLNNLYSYQDLSILCEIFENQFEVMHRTYGFNPRLCNSASKLRSGWIQKQKPKL